MTAQNDDVSPDQLILQQSENCSKNIMLICQSLLLLSQKRRTLEEKAIASYFHELVRENAKIIELLHSHLSSNSSSAQKTLELLHRLQTVNENLRTRIEELLKILNYDFNFLEQYFEYDYCARLLERKELEELQQIKTGLSSCVSQALS